MSELKVGDKVEVLDPGLLQMMALVPDMPPNNIGYVQELDFGSKNVILVSFPIGSSKIDEHSQSAPYPEHMIRKLND